MKTATKTSVIASLIPWILILLMTAHHHFNWSSLTGFDWPYAHTDARIYGHSFSVLSLVFGCGFLLGQNHAQKALIIIVAILGASSLWGFATNTGFFTVGLAYVALWLLNRINANASTKVIDIHSVITALAITVLVLIS